MKHFYFKKLISIKSQQSFLVLVAAFLLNLISTLNAQNRDATPFSKYAPSDELISIRNRNTKQFKNPDGSISAFVGSGPIHFFNGSGWEDIDNTISVNNNQDYKYYNESNSFFNYFPNNPFVSPLKYSYNNTIFEETVVSIDFIDQNGNYISSLPLNLNSTTATVGGNKITYSNFNNDLELVYTLESTRRKFDLVVKTANFLNQIPANAKKIIIKEKVAVNEAFNVKTDENGVNVFVENENILSFPKPVAFDSDEEHEFNANAGKITAIVNEANKSIDLSSVFDVAWLKATTRVFPVKLDPVANFLPTITTFWTGYQTSSTGKTSGYLRIATSTTASWAKYNISSIAAGATINSITYWGNHYSSSAVLKNCKITQMTSDPVLATAATLYAASTTGVVYNASFIYSNTTYGWRSALLNATANTYMQNNLALGWFAVGMGYVSGSTSFAYHYGVNGTAANITYLSIDYAIPACSGTPLAGSVNGSSSSGCSGSSTNLTASGISGGVGISYQWQSSTNGGVTWNNIIGATATTYNATGITVTTQYRIRTTCSNSGISNNSPAFTYNLASGSCQCAAYPAIFASSNADEEISNVTVGTLNNSSNCTTLAGGPGSIAQRYSNYTGIVAAPSFQQGASVPFSLTQTSCGGAYGNGFQIYIDYNQNGSFADAGEQAYSQPVAATGNHTKTGNIIIPAGATLGTTRMRVVVNETPFPSATNWATTGYTWGETEDYCVTITAAVGCSGTPNAGVAAISASSGCPSTTFNLSASGITTGTGLTYQWQSAPALGGPWGNITGATASTFATSTTTTTFYRLLTTCTNSGLSNTSSVVSYSVNSCTGSITMSDSFGDGWNGATMSLFVNGSLFQTFGSSFTTGTSQIINFCLPPASTYALVYNTGGSFPTEVGVTSFIINGASVYNVAAGGAVVGSTLVSGTACPPACSGTPNTGNAVISTAIGCTSVPFNLTATGITGGTGITYQWQSSSSGTGPWSNVTGATASNTTLIGAAGTTFYRLLTTCTSSGLSANSTTVSFTGSSCINVPASGSNTLACGTNAVVYDNGGTGNYIDNSNGFTVLNNAGTGVITLSGTYTGIETCCDYIQIYSGAGIGGTLLYTYGPLGTGNITTFSSPPGVPITIRFFSDGSVTGAGFQFNVSYSGSCIPPPCAGTPSAGIAAITVASGCANVPFTLSTTSLSIGTGLTFQWQSGPTATGPWTNITGATTANTTIAAGVTATTFYQLVSTCSNGPATNTSNVVSYNVNLSGLCSCGIYPNTFASSTIDEDITNVTVGSLNNTSNCSAVAPGQGSILNRYGNYTGSVAAPSFQQGATIPFSITQSYCPFAFAYNNIIQIYIDYNQNGSFADAGEQVYSQAAAVANNIATGNFTVPVGATVGTTRMRVVVVQNGTPGFNYAQNAYTWGETEDYCVTIIPFVPCSGAPNAGTAAISPSVGCIGSNFNLSASGITSGIDITYQWQSASSVSGPWTAVTNATNAALSTSVSATTYFQLVSTCTVSGLTASTSVVSYSTLPAGGCQCASHCIPTYGSACSSADFINNVSTTGAITNISNLNSGCSGAANNYSLYLNANLTASIGTTFTISVQAGTAWAQGFAVWIDYNQNNTFDASEYVYSNASSTTLNSGAITIPTTALTGSTRMRVRCAYASTPLNTDACTNLSFGETEDYCITLVCGNPTITASASSTLICLGSTASLTASGSNSYTWNPGAQTGSVVSVSPSSSTIYTVTGVNNNGCSNTKTLSLTVDIPTVTAASNPTAICIGNTATLTAGGASTYTWQPGTIVASSPTVSPASTTIYTVTGTSINGCSSTNTINISVNNLPIIAASVSPTAICIGSSATLSGSGANTYTWSPGASLVGASATVSPSSFTNYTLTGTDANGCVNTNTVDLIVNSLPSISASSNPLLLCYGSTATLSASGANTYTWNPGNLIGSPVNDAPLTTTIYTVSATDINGCNNTATLSLVVSTTVTASASPTVICLGGSSTLSGGNAVSYTWDPGNLSGASITVSPTTLTNYTVTGTDANGCISSTTLNVNVNSLPVLNPVATPAAICIGSSASLTVNGATTYTWQPGGPLIGTPQTVSPTTTTQYTVTGTDANGCVNTNTVDLIVNQLPTVTINTSTNNVCYGSAVALSAGGAGTYTWNPGSSNSSLISVTPLANTVYSVTGTDNNGCNNTSTISIAVSTTVTASASPTLICSGSNATLSGNNAVSYSWNPGAISGNNVVVNPVSTTNYTVTATDANGCVSTTTVNVTTDQTPTITPVANPAIICSGGLVNLSATGAVSYTWNPGSLVGSSVNDSPGSSTIYSVTGASTAGCLSASAQTVLVTVGGTATSSVNYYEGFEGIVYNNQLPNCSWSSTSPGSACTTYTVSDSATNRVPSSGNNFACFQAPTAPGGDYFFSNAVQLTAGAVYSMTLKYVASPGSNWTKFGVMYNNTQSPRGGGLGSQNSLMAATTITVINSGFNSSLPHADVGATFSVPTTGFYYIAIFAEGTSGFLSFDDNNATMYSNLPIDLVSYTATKYSDVVKLDWRTQSELNSEKFIIEKSIDAVKWDFVSETKAAGKSTSIQDYTTYDNNPYNGISYYRLLQQDFDKTMHNYGIRTVNFSRDRVSEIMLMPNPTSGSVNFDYYSQYKGSLSFKVNDVAGKVVIPETNVGEVTDGKKSGTIYLNEFKPGVYFVEFNCNNLKTVKKIIRQ